MYKGEEVTKTLAGHNFGTIDIIFILAIIFIICFIGYKIYKLKKINMK
ncbi:hypothetical protein K5V21_07960 [Clostridium sardiniense]|uniref:Uncharacterized protein n=1 Tax=Clostridium sardiniense TaxID=29369 RepID=A0ABS7KX74_CLOSR|nr:hypothetical protein [Clostridium sardiniense]MBY0755390.1 hypothetical protein [Clostridium sardiniense]MDQ0459838.1 hypothetical protein [Clostridium sardiniense]